MKPLILFLLFSSCNTNPKRMHNSQGELTTKDSLLYSNFKATVQNLVDNGFGSYQSKIDECIKLVRVKNTIGVYHLNEIQRLFVEFETMFNKEVVSTIVKKLEMSESSGLGFYSKKHNILLGGDPVLSSNSYFHLTDIP